MEWQRRQQPRPGWTPQGLRSAARHWSRRRRVEQREVCQRPGEERGQGEEPGRQVWVVPLPGCLPLGSSIEQQENYYLHHHILYTGLAQHCFFLFF